MIKRAYLSKLDYINFKDFNTFYLAENEDLTFSFTSQEYEIENAYIQLKNSKVIKTLKLKDGSITITKESELLQEGRLEIVVQIPNVKIWYLDGVKIKHLKEESILQLSSFFESQEKALQDLTARVEKLESDKHNIFKI